MVREKRRSLRRRGNTECQADGASESSETGAVASAPSSRQGSPTSGRKGRSFSPGRAGSRSAKAANAGSSATTINAGDDKGGVPSVLFEDVSKAKILISDIIKPTPCDRSDAFDKLADCEIFFKKEFTLLTGSFKERGARNSLKLLSLEEKAKGVIAASAGNHAQGLAYHGKLLKVPVTLVMPEVAPITKVQKCRDFGARVIIHGAHIGESMEHALSIAKKEGQKYINGYNHPHIIAGQGTIAMEILEQVPDVDIVVVPVGGAGLIAGISLVMKTLRPEVKVVGVEAEACQSFTEALKAGKPVKASVTNSLADGLAVPQVGDLAFKVAKDRVDSMALVTEKEIAIAVLRLVEMEKAIVEGSGAAGLAALLAHKVKDVKGKKVVAVLCGGNIDTTVLGRVIERGLAADSRLVRFTAHVSDRPGGIAGLTKDIAEIGASIKDIFHERAWHDGSVATVMVRCVVETLGHEHSERLHAKLKENYMLQWGV